MNLHDFLISFLGWFVVFPAALLCFAPMKNQLRSKRKHVPLFLAILLLLLITAISVSEALFSFHYNTMLPVLALVTFVAYQKTLRVPVYKSLFVFVLVFSFMSFLGNIANGFDARIHPTSTIDDFSLEASVFEAVLGTVASALFFYPLWKYGSRLIDRFDMKRVYYVAIPVWGIFLSFNLLITPRKYETLHVNKMQLAFWGSLTLFFLLFLLLCVLFYLIVSDMLDASETRERNQILEMQESAYHAQQRYMNETAKARHDFKHTIGTLDMLVKEGNLSAVRKFLDDYIAAQPQNETAFYCENTAVNALLNYYVQMAKTADTPIDLEISLPKSYSKVPAGEDRTAGENVTEKDTAPAEEHIVSDVDLCSIIGNILENAILACENVPKEDRFIDLAIRSGSDARLYIVATNSFDGKVRIDGENYLSTKKHGSGLGLKSIRETAARYKGSARFTHNGTEFYTDVVLP